MLDLRLYPVAVVFDGIEWPARANLCVYDLSTPFCSPFFLYPVLLAYTLHESKLHLAAHAIWRFTQPTDRAHATRPRPRLAISISTSDFALRPQSHESPLTALGCRKSCGLHSLPEISSNKEIARNAREGGEGAERRETRRGRLSTHSRLSPMSLQCRQQLPRRGAPRLVHPRRLRLPRRAAFDQNMLTFSESAAVLSRDAAQDVG